jgi:hypothetical protein
MVWRPRADISSENWLPFSRGSPNSFVEREAARLRADRQCIHGSNMHKGCQTVTGRGVRSEKRAAHRSYSSRGCFCYRGKCFSMVRKSLYPSSRDMVDA